MDWIPAKLLPLAFMAGLGACSDDGVSGGDAMTASSTGGLDTGDSAPAGSSGNEESAGGTGGTDDTGIDPTGMATSGDSTGGGSSGGGIGGLVCAAQCVEDADCFNNGIDVGLACSENGFCHTACEEAADCIPAFSGWVAQPCDDNDACAAGACVDYGGETGGCATAPTKVADCAALMLGEIEAMDVDGTPVTVCGETSGMCTEDPLGDMSCTFGCEANGCADPLTCEADGYCHCTSNDDCASAGTGDTCSADGACFFGCEDIADCEAILGPPPLDGQTLQCE